MNRRRCLGELPSVRCTTWTAYKPLVHNQPPSTLIHCEFRYCLDNTQRPVIEGEICVNMAGRVRAKLWRHAQQEGEWGTFSVAEARKFIDREIAAVAVDAATPLPLRW